MTAYAEKKKLRMRVETCKKNRINSWLCERAYKCGFQELLSTLPDTIMLSVFLVKGSVQDVCGNALQKSARRFAKSTVV